MLRRRIPPRLGHRRRLPRPPRILRASSGMWAEGGERTIARVLTAKRTMVQNTPVIRSFAGNHTDLVSPWVMLDEFGPMRIEPGTLGMDIKAHPHAGHPHHVPHLRKRPSHRQPRQRHRVPQGRIHALQFRTRRHSRGGLQRRNSPRRRTVHGFQIWLNTPSQEKFCNPSTVIHEREETPIVELGDAVIKVIIGSLNGCTSPVFVHACILLPHHADSGRPPRPPVDPTHNAFAHIIEGQLEGEGRNS